MTLEKIAELAIPITQKDCANSKAKKEHMRLQLIERVKAWAKTHAEQ